MSDVFSYHEGSTPLVISVPHDGWQIPNEQLMDMTGAGRGIPDTDWHVTELYEFAKAMGATVIAAKYSRYVVDLNRSSDDGVLYEGQLSTGLCPRETFAGEPLYFDDPEIDTAARVEQYWQPYHDQLRATLDQTRATHGIALLWDAHSIPSQVPSLFDGELPVLNIGTFDGVSCGAEIAAAVAAVAEHSDYETVVNGRFKGGFITRHYGQPEQGIHAIQLEIAQRAYMNERTLDYDRELAPKLQETLSAMLRAYLSGAE